MSYLQDKKEKKLKYLRVLYVAIAIIVLFYSRSIISGGLSYAASGVFRPVIVLGQNIGGKFANIGAAFISRNTLYSENKELRSKLAEQRLGMMNYEVVLSENAHLKELVSRSSGMGSVILSAVLGSPTQSLYDTLMLDVGTEDGVGEGDLAFAIGRNSKDEQVESIPIGRVVESYPRSSKVLLFTSSGEKTQVIVSPRSTGELDAEEAILYEDLQPTNSKNIFMEIVGRGGGNFEMILPRDFVLENGDKVILPGINPYVVGVVQTKISDPRDSFTKVLLTSPINANEIKFVLVDRGE